jgi:hypothetical protein
MCTGEECALCLLLDGMLCVYVLSPVGLKFKSNIYLLIFCLDDVIVQNGVLKAFTIVLYPISPFRSFNICFI